MTTARAHPVSRAARIVAHSVRLAARPLRQGLLRKLLTLVNTFGGSERSRPWQWMVNMTGVVATGGLGYESFPGPAGIFV